jgi:superfamily II DNA or RNA helicase
VSAPARSPDFDAIVRQYSAAEHSFGHRTFAQGAVKRLVTTQRSARATVQRYSDVFAQVRIDLDANGHLIGAACTCRKGARCRHQVAALLAWKAQKQEAAEREAVEQALAPVDHLLHSAQTQRPQKVRGWKVVRWNPFRIRAVSVDPHTRRFRPTHAAPPAGWATDDADPVAQLSPLVGHPHVYDPQGALLAVHRGPICQQWTLLPDGGVQIGFTIDGHAVAPEDLQPTTAPNAPTCVQVPGAVLLGHHSLFAAQLIRALTQRGLTFPAVAIDALFERLQSFQNVMPVHLGDSLRGTALDASPQPIVRLAVTPDGLSVHVGVRPLGPTGEWRPTLAEDARPQAIYGDQDGVRCWAERSPRAEASARTQALSGVPLPPSGLVGLDTAGEVLDALEARAADGRITVEWRDDRPAATAHTSDIRLEFQLTEGWLQVGGALQVDDFTVPLRSVLRALQGGHDFVAVKNRGWMRLGRRLQSALRGLSNLADPDGKLSAAALGLLSELEDDGIEVITDAQLDAARTRFAAARDLPIEVPAGLAAILRPYQQDGFTWLARTAEWSSGACLADDMGLGKTLQAITLLLRRQPQGRALVVCPVSVLAAWSSELARFAPGLMVRRYHGPGRKLPLHADVVLTTWDTMVRDRSKLEDTAFATLVLDEAQYIKNPRSRRAAATRALSAAFTLALTGTPIENNPVDLWSLMQVLVPGLLRSETHFRSTFARPILAGDAGQAELFARILSPFILRRTKEAVAADLPPKLECLLPVELSARERALYDGVRMAALDGVDQTTGPRLRIHILQALLRLRQLACHPRLADPTSRVQSSKMKALQSRVRKVVAGGEQVLVFSQFTRHLDLAEEALSGLRIVRLQGSMSASARQRSVERFQSGGADVFLISTKAGGTGLTLTAASEVIHLDPWWNPAVEDQATDRAHRIGQHKAVRVLRLVAKDTVEQLIVDLQDKKRDVAEAVLSGANGGGALDTDALLKLLQAA